VTAHSIPDLETSSPAISRRCLPSTPRASNLIDTLSVGVDRIQRNFEPLQRQVAKLIFYTAFVDGKLEAPRSLLPEVHRLYFEPQYPEFGARTMWSLSNAFTSAFKKLDPGTAVQSDRKAG